MNEYNPNQQNPQTPENDGVTSPHEQVYTVGAQNDQPKEEQGYTAPTGNRYTYSAGAPYTPSDGYYHNQNEAPLPKKEKRKAAFIALAVAGCMLLSLLMGCGGAAMTWVLMSQPTEEASGSTGQQGDTQSGLNMEQQDPVGLPGSEEVDGVPSQTPSQVTIQKNNGTSVITTTGKVGDEDLSYADVVALVENSVVEITTNYVVSGSMFSQYVSSGAGSGVIIAQEGKIGYIVTNNHVIDGATNIVVRLKDGTELNAKLVGTDAQTDLAVLTVETELKLTLAVLGDSNSLVVGQEVLAIGNPLGELGGTVTNGIVSALERQVTIDGGNMTLLQTNAAVNPGNSGGGLFNMRGELIGVVNAKSSGDDVEGLGFAIPVNTVFEIATELIEHGYVRGRPALGITVSIGRQQSFLQVMTFIYVTDPGESDLQVNDILYSIEGVEITSSDAIASAISGKSVGDKVEIVVLRNNKEVSVQVELIEYVPQGAE